MTSSPIEDSKPSPAYSSFEDGKSLADLMGTLEFGCVQANMSGLSLKNITDRTNIRQGMTRSDYEFFRPGERVPTKPLEIIQACNEAYKRVGIIRRIIDLMADFTVQGIRLEHTSKRQNKFYQEWFKKVNGVERSERFVNYLARKANLVVYRMNGKINKKMEKKMSLVTGDDSPALQDINVDARTIPLKYIFFCPTQLKVLGEEFSYVAGEPQYLLRLPQMNEVGKIKKNKVLYNGIPELIKKAIENNKSEIELPRERVRPFFYKKDDEELWATPITCSILEDLFQYNKMKLADSAALDSAIARIRLWKLGDLDKKIVPNQAVIEKLSDILTNNTGGGAMDIIWTPDIELQESSTDVHKFLGSAKYEECKSAIYAAFGIPQSLTGSQSQSGMTNNFVSMKTFIEALQYLRSLLIEFWEYEVRLVQKAMGYAKPPVIVFDYMSFTDEAAIKNLYIHLWDRNIISTEAIRQKFGEDNDLENVRVKRDMDKRERGIMPPKSGPYNNAHVEDDLLKLFVQQGSVTPSEAGVELKTKDPSQQSKLEMEKNNAGEQEFDNDPGELSPGRPKNSQDTQKRKQRTPKPQTGQSMAMWLWANEAQPVISKEINKIVLADKNVKTVRELTQSEKDDLEEYKFSVFLNVEPFSQITEDILCSAVEKGMDADFIKVRQDLKSNFIGNTGQLPTAEQLRYLQCFLYTQKHGD